MVTKKVKCVLIDVAISGDRNVIKKEAEEFLKHKNRAIEIKCVCYVKTRLITVINKSGN
jgi:fibrillarin-like rRNA methylase